VIRRGILLSLLVCACGGDDSNMMVEVDAPPAPTAPTAQQLRDAIGTCANVIGGPYAKDSGGTANINICGLTGAVAWTADLDVDCDGKQSTQCSLQTDPSYQNQTAATDSTGQALDAAALPYVVVPGKSTKWDYRAAGLSMGSVFAVVYRDTVMYGVAGDVGPTSIIGEASYKMAELLGINPDPSTGGTNEAVAYIGFTGAGAIVKPIEDPDLAVSLGLELATALLAQ
jgi:hypothetical protein